jgi:hypothetical protein
MEASPRDPALVAPFQPYYGEVLALLTQHLARHPPPGAMLVAWRAGIVSALAYAVLKEGLSADERAVYIRAVCESMVQATWEAVNRWNTEVSSKGEKHDRS